MTVSSSATTIQYSGNGSSFSFPINTFNFWELEVVLVSAAGVETVWTEGTEYSIISSSGALFGDGNTGTLNVFTGGPDYTPQSGEKLRITRKSDRVQATDWVDGDPFPADTVEDAVDRLTMITQELWDRITRAPLMSEANAQLYPSGFILPTPSASKAIGWNAAATNLENLTLSAPAFVTGSGVPGAGTGNNGDMYINVSTGDLYGPKASGAWGGIVANIIGPAGPSGAGTGDVVGPASSVADRVATYSNGTGKLIKDSGVLITALATLASPALTGTPTAPTAAPGANSTQISTTAFVKAAIDVVLGGVAASFDTLAEIATELALKATIASPTFTGTPAAPTASGGTNTTQLATCAFVLANASAALTGSVIMYAGSSLPSGYLVCDGTAVSRTTYSALFTAISTTWGAGDGSTTFNLPDFRGRVPVGSGTGAVAETRAAANFNTSDVITVASNTQALKPKWLTGMPVQITTDGVLPTGISAATTYYVRRLSATTISLYTSLAAAIDLSATTGRVNITATGSGNHTITCTLQVRALADAFGVETNSDFPEHDHVVSQSASLSGGGSSPGPGGTTTQRSSRDGDANGVTNMPPSAVVQMLIKT